MVQLQHVREAQAGRAWLQGGLAGFVATGPNDCSSCHMGINDGSGSGDSCGKEGIATHRPTNRDAYVFSPAYTFFHWRGNAKALTYRVPALQFALSPSPSLESLLSPRVQLIMRLRNLRNQQLLEDRYVCDNARGRRLQRRHLHL